MSEKSIETQIINYLNNNDCYVWKVNAGRMRSRYKGREYMIKLAPTGHSDVQGIHIKTGRFIAIEVKTPERRKEVSSSQQFFLERIKNAGGISGVATSKEEALLIIESSL